MLSFIVRIATAFYVLIDHTRNCTLSLAPQLDMPQREQGNPGSLFYLCIEADSTTATSNSKGVE